MAEEQVTVTALATIESLAPAKLFEREIIDPILEKIEAEVRAVTFDITTEKGRKGCASLAYKVSRTKTFIDDQRLNLVAEQKRQLATIDAEGKRIRDRLDTLRDEVKQPLVAWEEQEKARVKRLEELCERIETIPMFNTIPTLAEINQRIVELNGIDLSMTDEYLARATRAKEAGLEKLTIQLKQAEKAEAERIELDLLRAEQAERQRKEQEEREAREKQEREERERKAREEREKQIALEAEAKAKREAEEKAARERKAAEEREAQIKREKEQAEERARKAEADRIAAEQKAKRDAEEAERQAKLREEQAAKAERERIERERKEEERKAQELREAEERRQANRKHRLGIEKAIAKELVGYIEPALDESLSAQEVAERIVAHIREGKVPHLKIEY